MKRIIFLSLFFLSILILFPKKIYACSIAGGYGSISCNAKGESSNISVPSNIEHKNGIITFSSLSEYISSKDIDRGFAYMEENCKEDLSQIRKRANDLANKKYVEGEYFSIFPLNLEKKQKLDDCFYIETSRLGDFIINETKVKEYCPAQEDPFGCTYVPMKSHTKYIEYLIKNPSTDSYLNLSLYLIFLILPIIFLFFLIKERELSIFFKPNKVNIIATVLLILMFPINKILLYIIGINLDLKTLIPYIIVSYSISSFVKYIYLKRKKISTLGLIILFVTTLVAGLMALTFKTETNQIIMKPDKTIQKYVPQ